MVVCVVTISDIEWSGFLMEVALDGARLFAWLRTTESEGVSRAGERWQTLVQSFLYFRALDYTNGDDGQSSRMA